ncbi:MAG: gamma carbonic anhydrase family protein [Ignavibacteriaceae bacterium]|nr:gamma carbonic anhydrase family protein [Ignavibacteriaceae bacterium]
MEEVNYYPYLTKYPVVPDSVFVAPGARVIGDVEIGEKSSVWFNCVIRGDILPIRIGRYTNIQDGAILHVTAPSNPLSIGSYVTVGHNAVIHACTIEDYTLIGMGSVVLDGAVVEQIA